MNEWSKRPKKGLKVVVEKLLSSAQEGDYCLGGECDMFAKIV